MENTIDPGEEIAVKADAMLKKTEVIKDDENIDADEGLGLGQL